MHATRDPAELIAPPLNGAPDPYGGTPLGVEAAWWPNGIDVSPVAQAVQPEIAL